MSGDGRWRLALPRTDPTLSDAERTVLERWANTLPIDAYMPTGWTSTVHPRDPYIGQIIYESDTQRLWRWNGTAWRWAGGNVPRFTLTGSTKSIAHNTVTDVDAWTTETEDSDGLVTTAGSFTCPTLFPGRWQFNYSTEWTANATGTRASWCDRGGIRYGKSEGPGQATNAISNSGSVSVTLAASDVMKIVVYQNSGGALALASSSFFDGVYLGPID